MSQPLALDADDAQPTVANVAAISEEAPSKRIKLADILAYPKELFKLIYDDLPELQLPKELIHVIISYVATEFTFIGKNGQEITVSATLLSSRKSKYYKYKGCGWKYRWLCEWQESKALVQTRDTEAKDCEFLDLVPTVPEEGMKPTPKLNQKLCALQCHRGPNDDVPPYLTPESATLQVGIDNGDMNFIGYMTFWPMGFNICKMKQTDNRFLDLAAKEFWGDAEIQHENLAIENSRDETFTGTFSARDQALGWIRGTHEKAIGGGDYYVETGTFANKKLNGPDCMQYWQCGEVLERKAKYGTFSEGKLVGDMNTSMRFKPAPLADHVHCLTTFGKFTGKAESNGVKIKSVSETDSVMMTYAKSKTDHFEKHYLHIGTLDNESLLEGKECLAIHYPPCGQRITQLGMYSSGVFREGYFLLDGLLYHWDDNCRKLVESKTAIAALKSRMDLAYRASFVGPQPVRDRWHPDEDPETLEQHAVRGQAILEEFERQSAKCAEVLVW